MDYIKLIEKNHMKTEVPHFKSGDTVRVKIKVIEGNRERLQTFEGVCIGRKNSGIKESFTLRRIGSHGVGIERTFPLHSPRVQEISIVKQGLVTKAKLFYLRDKVGKKAKIKEKSYVKKEENS